MHVIVALIAVYYTLAYRAYITADTIPELAARLYKVQDVIDYIDNNNESMILAGFDPKQMYQYSVHR